MWHKQATHRPLSNFSFFASMPRSWAKINSSFASTPSTKHERNFFSPYNPKICDDLLPSKERWNLVTQNTVAVPLFSNQPHSTILPLADTISSSELIAPLVTGACPKNFPLQSIHSRTKSNLWLPSYFRLPAHSANQGPSQRKSNDKNTPTRPMEATLYMWRVPRIQLQGTRLKVLKRVPKGNRNTTKQS